MKVEVKPYIPKLIFPCFAKCKLTERYALLTSGENRNIYSTYLDSNEIHKTTLDNLVNEYEILPSGTQITLTQE